MARERIISGEAHDSDGDDVAMQSLRPQRLDDYVGQPKLVERLSIALEAVKQRGDAMEHVLLHGPPGLGKTTLAFIIANEMGTRLTSTSGPALTKPSDLVGVLTRLQPRDVLFIDEIHRLNIALEEYLYSAMEDFRIDVQIDTGMHAKTITMPLQPFTLIGATTRAGLISGPMQSRFGIAHNLEYYSEVDLLTILHRSSSLLTMNVEGAGDADDESDISPQRPKSRKSLDSLRTIASRSRGTPRVANRLLRRVRDYAQVRAHGLVSPAAVNKALMLEGVDELGLDELDRRYLRVIAEIYEGGPVGLEAVAATLGEDVGTLEEVVEPYLLQIGFLARTRRGRQLTRTGAEHLGVKLKTKSQPEQPEPPAQSDD